MISDCAQQSTELGELIHVSDCRAHESLSVRKAHREHLIKQGPQCVRRGQPRRARPKHNGCQAVAPCIYSELCRLLTRWCFNERSLHNAGNADTYRS